MSGKKKQTTQMLLFHRDSNPVKLNRKKGRAANLQLQNKQRSNEQDLVYHNKDQLFNELF